MADSSKSTGLAKPLVGAKNEAEKESKKKRKRGKKFRAKFNQNTEEKSQEGSTLVRDEQNVDGNNEDSKTNIEEDSPMGTTSGKTESAEKIGEDISSQQSDQMATDGAVQGDKKSEEFVSKDGQQEHKTTEEPSGEQKVDVLEQTKQEEVDGKKLKSKRASFSLLRSKRNSKSKHSSGEDKRVEDMTDEYGIWGVVSAKVVGKDGETSEQDRKDEAKTELGASSVDMKSNDAEKPLEGTQEKSLSKGNKGKKLKHLPSFGRNKKKADITTKYAEVEIPDSETQELKEDGPVRSERSESTRDEVSESSENASNEPVLVHTSDLNATAEAGTESEKKDAGVPKRKKSLLGLKRNKKPTKMRKLSKSEDEQKTKIDGSEKISASKENDDVSTTAGACVETKAVEIEEKNSGSMEKKVEPNAPKTEDLQAEEKSEAAEAEVGSINKATSSPEGEEHGATAAEETDHVSSKKERKSGLLRSFKKMKSFDKSQQRKKKSQKSTNSVKAKEDPGKNVEQSDKGENSKPEQTTEVQEAAEGINEECASDREGTSTAVKRKTSDLKNVGVTQAMKRQKEHDENGSESLTDFQDNNEGVDGEPVVQQQDQSSSEEIGELQTEKNVKEECADELTSQAKETQQAEERNQGEDAANANQTRMGEVGEKDGESPAENQDLAQESEDESFGSANTVVSVEQLSSHEPKIGAEDTQLKHEGVASGVYGETVVQQEDQSASEEISALQTEINDKEECADELTSQAKEELAQQKINEQGQTVNKESEVEDDIPRESLTSDDTQDEEVWNKANELCSSLMKTAKELKDKKETQQAEERNQGEDAANANQTQMGGVDEKDEESPAGNQDMVQETEDESYGSAITVASVEQPTSHEPKMGIEDTQLKHDGVSSETERAGVAASQADDMAEPKAEETSQVTESPFGEAEHKEDYPEGSSETEISRESQVKQETEPKTDEAEKLRTSQEEASSESEVVESKAEEKTEPKAEDAEEIRVGNEGVSSETAILQVADSKAEDNTENPEDSTEIETSRYTKPQVEHETELKTEDAKESTETETSEAIESTVEKEAEHRTEDQEESSVANTPQVSQVEQKIKPKTEDAEVVESKAEDAEEARAIHEEGSLENMKGESKPKDIESTTEIDEEILDVRDGVSSEHEVVELNAEEKTEPKNEDNEEIQASSEEPSPEKVTSETTSDVDITRKKNKKNKKNKKKENWIMVQHLEMNEEVTRQLGSMLDVLGAFKRTTNCCTVM